jgi:hypothetical protein
MHLDGSVGYLQGRPNPDKVMSWLPMPLRPATKRQERRWALKLNLIIAQHFCN